MKRAVKRKDMVVDGDDLQLLRQANYLSPSSLSDVAACIFLELYLMPASHISFW